MKLVAFFAVVALWIMQATNVAASDVIVGIASVDDGRPTRYDGGSFRGRVSSGARFDAAALTVASRDLPLGSCVEVWRVRGRAVTAKVDDRGPCATPYCQRRSPWLLRRLIDLKPRVGKLIGCDGLCRVSFRPVPCDDGP